MRDPKRVAILISGRGSNMRALVTSAENYEVVLVASNKPRAEGLEWASARGFPTWSLESKGTRKEEYDRELSAALENAGAGTIALAGFMRILSPWFVEKWAGRIINIHPSLLPYYPGANAYRQAFEEGVRVSGCTAHFVTEQLDQGPVILQDVFHIRVGEDTLDVVKEHGKALESEVLARAVQLFVTDQLVVKDKKVIFRPGMNPAA
jgi:formyltetrahydrofolate-dependent phosphoribosylglycinamide formyltransferase